MADLERRLLEGGEDNSLQIASAWLDEAMVNCPNRAFYCLDVYRALAAQASKGRQVMIKDNSTHVNTGGGDVTGSAFGHSRVDAQVIQNLKGRIESSANIDLQGQTIFKEALDEFAAQDWGEEFKAEMVGELEKLRAEIAKEKPSEGMLKKCWAAIKGVAGALSTIGKLAVWLGGRFPKLFA
jgi:hypothetical protein